VETAVSRSRKATFVAEALPRIERLARERRYVAAFDLAREAERVGGPGVVTGEHGQFLRTSICSPSFSMGIGPGSHRLQLR
jgi:hypothetical protein